MTTDITTIDEAKRLAEQRRQTAVLKAIGLDRVPAEQREIALAISKRYELDLMLKHLVLVDGRPYITRDGLLHVAHRSGQLDGIEVTDPVLEDNYWRARCSVYRKDMSRPFTYQGRYPLAGQNKKYAPEMAVKVAEVMALRRAFDVSAPVIEERWDRDLGPVEPPPSIREQVAAQRAAVTTSGRESTGGPTPVGPDTGATVSDMGMTVSKEPTYPADIEVTGLDGDMVRPLPTAAARQATSQSSATNAEAGKPTAAQDSGEVVGREGSSTAGSASPESMTQAPEGAPSSSDEPPPPSGAADFCGHNGGMLGTCSRAPGHTGKHQSEDGSWPQERKGKR